jgi:hypothetical protein
MQQYLGARQMCCNKYLYQVLVFTLAKKLCQDFGAERLKRKKNERKNEYMQN